MHSSLSSVFELFARADDCLATAAPQPKYRSRMMEHFQLGSAHRGAYVAGTVSPKQRFATVAADVDTVLGRFDPLSKSE